MPFKALKFLKPQAVPLFLRSLQGDISPDNYCYSPPNLSLPRLASGFVQQAYPSISGSSYPSVRGSSYPISRGSSYGSYGSSPQTLTSLFGVSGQSSVRIETPHSGVIQY